MVRHSTTLARVQSLFGELRFCKPCGTAKKKKKKSTSMCWNVEYIPFSAPSPILCSVILTLLI